jgi:hypothetical protein
MDGARNLVLKAERPITTPCTDQKQERSGIADYVMSYDNDTNLESSFVVVEAKRMITFSTGPPQVATYLGTSRIPVSNQKNSADLEISEEAQDISSLGGRRRGAQTQLELMTSAVKRYQDIFCKLNDAVTDLTKKRKLKLFIRK